MSEIKKSGIDLDAFKKNQSEENIDINKKIRIGIIGTGSIAEAHLQKYLEMPDVEIVAGADLIEGKAAAFFEKYNVEGAKCFRSHKELIDAGVYKVNISVHSFEQGDEEDYLRYIRECLDFADYASAHGVLTVLRLWNQGFDEGRNTKTEALIHERFPNEWKWGRKGARIRDKLHLEYDTRFAWPDMEADDMGSGVFCYGLKDHFGILCDGRVIPCCLDREGAVTLGNIFEENSIEEILSSPRALAMRKGFTERRATEELCRKCGYARRF